MTHHVYVVHKLDEQTALALQAAGALEEELSEQLPHNIGAEWCVRERIEPLLQGWVAHQLGLLRSWSSRIFASEAWKPVTAPRGCSRWVWEDFKPFLVSHRGASLIEALQVQKLGNFWGLLQLGDECHLGEVLNADKAKVCW